jgi:uncharacterized damage-inducible protein DinB
VTDARPGWPPSKAAGAARRDAAQVEIPLDLASRPAENQGFLPTREEAPVKLTDLFIADLDREGPLVRRALEAVPEGREEWKPHAKSMPLGRLAGLVAMMPSWLTMMIEKEEFDLSPPPGTKSPFSRELKTRRELVQAADEGVAGARKALHGTTDDHLMKPWRLKVAGKVVAEQPRHVMLRDSLMHLSHHRGQLTVYLRMNDVPVPAIYGPSADDQRFS